MSKQRISMLLVVAALAGSTVLARGQSCSDPDLDCNSKIWYDSSTGMVDGYITTDYDVDWDWDVYDGSMSQAELVNPDGTEADYDYDNELLNDDYSEADVSADSDGYGTYTLFGLYTLFEYNDDMSACLDDDEESDDPWWDCYMWLDGDIGDSEDIDESEDTLSIEPTITITSADISQDQVVLQLKGDLPTTGVLDLRMTGASGAEPVYVLTTGDTYGPGQETIPFDQGGLQSDSGNFGEYQQLVAKWTPGNGNATNTYTYHIKVLGVYKQTQYNTPNESTCSGSPTGVTMWSSSGSGFSGAVLSGFDSRVTNSKGGTGSGISIFFGGVQQEQTYSSGSGDLRRCASINGSIGSLGDSTIAVCHGRVSGALVNDPDLYVSGRSVYIRGEGVKTVADACVACCSDPVVTGSHSHFDNYTTDGACSGIPSLPSALSVILY